MEVPNVTFLNRSAAAPNRVRPSRPAPPVVSQTVGTPASSARAMFSKTPATSGAPTATPIRFPLILLTPYTVECGPIVPYGMLTPSEGAASLVDVYRLSYHRDVDLLPVDLAAEFPFRVVNFPPPIDVVWTGPAG